MLKFLAKIFGGEGKTNLPKCSDTGHGEDFYTGQTREHVFDNKRSTSYEVRDGKTGKNIWTSAEPPHFVTPRYYNSFDIIDSFDKQRRFSDAYVVAWDALQLVPAVARKGAEKYSGKWGVSSIPPLEYVLEHLVIERDFSKMDEVERLLKLPEELQKFITLVVEAREDARLLQRIFDHLKNNPGFLQKHMGKYLQEDTHRIAYLLNRSEVRGIIRKEKSGNTNKLWLNA